MTAVELAAAAGVSNAAIWMAINRGTLKGTWGVSYSNPNNPVRAWLIDPESAAAYLNKKRGPRFKGIRAKAAPEQADAKAEA